jgi:choline kinase
MRELHEGVDLLPHERNEDPFVWRNIEKWTQRCSQIVSWIDTTAHRQSASTKLTAQRQFVCGTDWVTFREVLDKYRKWLYEQYGGASKVKQQLVFAHNDVILPVNLSFTQADRVDSIRKPAANGSLWGVALATPRKPA